MSDINQNWLFLDIKAAFGLLSRIPVRLDFDAAKRRSAFATWAYPLVGLVIGGLAGLLGWGLMATGVPAGMAAGLVLAFMVLITGAMHEDGLADCADGMGGGHDIERRLEIMKDSRIGAYGALALALALLIRHAGIAGFSGPELVFTLAAIGAASRAMMVLVMFLGDSARKTGLAANTGQPPPRSAGTALLIGLGACLVLTGSSGITLFVLMAITALTMLWVSQKLLRGYTGDVLGAVQQITEITGLTVAIALL